MIPLGTPTLAAGVQHDYEELVLRNPLVAARASVWGQRCRGTALSRQRVLAKLAAVPRQFGTSSKKRAVRAAAPVMTRGEGARSAPADENYTRSQCLGANSQACPTARQP